LKSFSTGGTFSSGGQNAIRALASVYLHRPD
jgi:hypothetical protein